MASRLFYQNLNTLEREPVKIWALVSIGTSGAPTLSRGKGIASVAGGAGASATGLYTVTLDDKYVRLLRASGTVMKSAAAIPLVVQLSSETVASNRTVVFSCTSIGTTPALADPANGDKLYLEIVLGNDSD